jgi:glucose-6-phosphate isomerase
MTQAPVRLDTNGFFDHIAGDGGLRREDVDRLVPRVAAVLDDIAERREAGALPFHDLPYDAALLARCKEMACRLAGDFERMVVLGIGGSALGTKAVLDAVPADRRAPGGMPVHVVDNVDPATFARLLDGIDLRRTVFNVVSKSGGTAETAAQLLIVRRRLADTLGADAWKRHVTVTTDPAKGPLRSMVQAHDLLSLEVPPGVGGRFSVLSAVSLMPLAAAGCNIDALCAGARAADAGARERDVWRNPAALHATLLYLAATEAGANVHVLMPYADGLLRIAEWYQQLWAESLGKRVGLDGSVLEVGQTPVRALGATDQHSQVQLYVEGPRDKVVTFLRVERHQPEMAIPAADDLPEEFGYLAGLGLGELLNMEQTATELALAEAGRLTSKFVLERLDEAALGCLFHWMEVQTLVAGGLYNVDPLDQPGVEAGKLMTRAMAGIDGMDDVREKVREYLVRRRPELIIG